DPAALDPADAEEADISIVGKTGDLQLQRTLRVHRRRRHVRDDGFEQRCHIAAGRVGTEACIPLQGRGINYRKVELFLGCTQPVEEVEGLVQDPARPRAAAVDLLYAD